MLHVLGVHLWWTCVLVALHTQAALQTISIDDTFGDPVTGQQIIYQPAEGWNGIDCPACTARPDGSQTHSGTWHDSTFNRDPGSNDFPNQVLSATTTFNGNSVSVVCVLARTTSSPSGNSDMTFYIDGIIVGTFVRPAPGTSGFDYDVTVYSNTSLTPGVHTITVQNGHVNGDKSLLILDRIIYTREIPDPTSSTQNSREPPPQPSVSQSSNVEPSVTEEPTPQPSGSQSSQTGPGVTKEPTTQPPDPQPSSSRSPDVAPDAVEEPTAQPNAQSSKVEPGIIAGAVVGSVVFALALVLLLIFFCRTRKTRLNEDAANHRIDAFSSTATPAPMTYIGPSQHGLHHPRASVSQSTSSNHAHPAGLNRTTPSDSSYDPYRGYQGGYTTGGTSKAERMQASNAALLAYDDNTSNGMGNTSGSSQAGDQRYLNRGPSTRAPTEAPPAYEHSDSGPSSHGSSATGRKIRR